MLPRLHINSDHHDIHISIIKLNLSLVKRPLISLKCSFVYDTILRIFIHLYSQKRICCKLPQICCKLRFYRPAASCQQVATGLLTSSTCSKSVEIRLAASWYLQTWCKLTKRLASSLHMSISSKPDRTTCSKSDERIKADASWENQTCCKLPFAELMQVISSTCIKSVH